MLHWLVRIALSRDAIIELQMRTEFKTPSPHQTRSQTARSASFSETVWIDRVTGCMQQQTFTRQTSIWGSARKKCVSVCLTRCSCILARHYLDDCLWCSEFHLIHVDLKRRYWMYVMSAGWRHPIVSEARWLRFRRWHWNQGQLGAASMGWKSLFVVGAEPHWWVIKLDHGKQRALSPELTWSHAHDQSFTAVPCRLATA